MDLNAVLTEIKSRPDFARAGMVLIHLGLVRACDLEGQRVKSLIVRHDRTRAEAIRREMVKRPGIVEIILHLHDGWLEVGEPIMLAAVAGRTRGEVIPVLSELIDRLKKEAVSKEEETA